MTDPEFLDAAEALLASVEAACDRINEETDADVDNQRVGNMVTLTFPNGSQIIINLQKPLQEVWMAAKSGGYHFRWGAGQWLDTKSGCDFQAELSRNASAQAGCDISFAS
jgi:CyaY protein